MSVYHGPLETTTLDNLTFRTVLGTSQHLQLVVMCLQPSEEIGSEVHPQTDQFFRVELGEAEVKIDDQAFVLKAGDAIIVPAGSQHNVRNLSDSEVVKLYTIYTPPQHPDGTVHATRADALAAEEHHSS